MSNTINIHGKEYMPVSERLKLAHTGAQLQGIKTEVLQFAPVVVIKATVNISGVEYTGISSANPVKAIEKSNPFEVAETSAVGRALGFANFGLLDSVASADEMIKAQGQEDPLPPSEDGYTRELVTQPEDVKVCSQHGEPVAMIKGKSKSTGKEYWYHRNDEGQICFGAGYKE